MIRFFINTLVHYTIHINSVKMFMITDRDLQQMWTMSPEELKVAIDILEDNKNRLYEEIDYNEMQEINTTKATYEYIYLSKTIRRHEKGLAEIEKYIIDTEDSKMSHGEFITAYEIWNDIDVNLWKYTKLLDELKNGPYADYIEICDK